jgi:hypothetical protein
VELPVDACCLEVTTGHSITHEWLLCVLRFGAFLNSNIKGVTSNIIKCPGGRKFAILSKKASTKAELSNFEPSAEGNPPAGHFVKIDKSLIYIKSPPKSTPI